MCPKHLSTQECGDPRGRERRLDAQGREQLLQSPLQRQDRTGMYSSSDAAAGGTHAQHSTIHHTFIS